MSMVKTDYAKRLQQELLERRQRQGRRVMLWVLAWVIVSVPTFYLGAPFWGTALGLLVMIPWALALILLGGEIKTWLDLGSQIENTGKTVTNQQALEMLAATRKPIWLYLRDFRRTSYDKYTQYPGDMWNYFGGPMYKNVVEDRLVELLASRLTCLKLHSPSDTDPREHAPCLRILTDDSAWKDVLTQWAEISTLIVIDPNSLRRGPSGLVDECSLIDTNPELSAKTLLIATKEEIESIDTTFPGFSDKVSWCLTISTRDRARFRDFELPGSLVEYLSK
jgi:hypothetical protein